MTIISQSERYRISPRVELSAGEAFQVSAGPYYICGGGGRKIAMGEKSGTVFRFRLHCVGEDGTEWIEANQGTGRLARIPIFKSEQRDATTGITHRPYKFRRSKKLIAQKKRR